MSSGDPPSARCAVCGAVAAGPCARCRRLVCADCCELTDGGAGTFAMCSRCIRTGGSSLAPGYRQLFGWLAAIVLALVAVATALVLLRH